MNRAYSLLTVKEINAERRVISGIASTPEADRMGDVIEPKGMTFAADLPLLLFHDTQNPVGRVSFTQPTADGVRFEAHLPLIEQPGIVKDEVDRAWDLVKHKLIAGVSIGFRVLDDAIERLKDGGLRFLKTEVLELSLVAIPANASAQILTVKSLDRGLAASGSESPIESRQAAGVSASVVHVAHKGAPPMKTLAEQISTFEATRQTKSARMTEIMTKSGDEGVTLDAEQEQEYDDLKAEVKKLDAHLVRLADLEEANKKAAKPVNGSNVQQAADSRQGVIHVKDRLAPGIEFARYAMCLATAKGFASQALEIAKERYPDQVRIQTVLKAAVAAGTTTDSTWAGSLVDYQDFAGDFVEFLRPATIVGKFGTGNIPSLRRVPFNISIQGQTSGGDGYWVGEGKPKPLTKFDFAPTTLRFTKVANIAVLTQELVRFSSPSAETLVRDGLAAAIIERIDIDFVDPDVSEITDVRPASITNGLTGISATGTGDADDVRTDLTSLFGSFIADNLTPSTGVWIMNANTALRLSLMRNALGQPEFTGIGMMGGTFEGLPVIVSQYVNTGLVILVNASDIFLADDGQVVIDASREASLQMDSAPTNNSGTPTAAQLVSMFQTNSIAIRAERFINWKRRRSGAVAYLQNVAWGGTPGSGGSPVI